MKKYKVGDKIILKSNFVTTIVFEIVEVKENTYSYQPIWSSHSDINNYTRSSNAKTLENLTKKVGNLEIFKKLYG